MCEVCVCVWLRGFTGYKSKRVCVCVRCVCGVCVWLRGFTGTGLGEVVCVVLA